MATATSRSGASRARPALPPVTVARFEEVQHLIERLVDENTDTFVAAGQAFRDRHREGTSRPLVYHEITAVARGLGTNIEDAKQQAEEAGLVHHDEPQPQEVLLAAGVSTAPALVRSALRVVALLEMAPDEFERVREEGAEQLAAAIDEACKPLQKLGLQDARSRAVEALNHLAREAGVEPGKALELVVRTVSQGLGHAMSHLVPTSPSLDGSSSSSPESSAGPAEPSSTTPPGETPAD